MQEFNPGISCAAEVLIPKPPQTANPAAPRDETTPGTLNDKSLHQITGPYKPRRPTKLAKKRERESEGSVLLEVETDFHTSTFLNPDPVSGSTWLALT